MSWPSGVLMVTGVETGSASVEATATPPMAAVEARASDATATAPRLVRLGCRMCELPWCERDCVVRPVSGARPHPRGLLASSRVERADEFRAAPDHAASG